MLIIIILYKNRKKPLKKQTIFLLKINSYTYNNPAAGQAFVNTLNSNKNAINLTSIDSSLSGYTLCNWKLGSDNYPALNC